MITIVVRHLIMHIKTNIVFNYASFDYDSGETRINLREPSLKKCTHITFLDPEILRRLHNI